MKTAILARIMLFIITQVFTKSAQPLCRSHSDVQKRTTGLTRGSLALSFQLVRLSIWMAQHYMRQWQPSSLLKSMSTSLTLDNLLLLG